MILSTHIESEIGNLSETLVNTKFEDAENVIEDFCKKNQMIVSFEENGRIYQYGDTNKVKTSTDKISSLSQEMMFADRPQSYLFTIVSLTSSNQELISALLKLLPFLLALIFSVSLFFVSLRGYAVVLLLDLLQKSAKFPDEWQIWI